MNSYFLRDWRELQPGFQGFRVLIGFADAVCMFVLYKYIPDPEKENGTFCLTHWSYRLLTHS